MAANTSPIFVKNITGSGATWTNSDSAATKKTISPTVGAEGCRVHSIAITSDDTTSRDFLLYLSNGTTDFLIGTVSAVAGAGTVSTTPAISVLSKANLLPWVTADYSMLIPPSWSLKMSNATQVTSGKTVAVTTICGDY